MPYVTKDMLEASICEDSFFEFTQRYWETIIAEVPVWNWHIEYLCGELQELAERVFEGEPKKEDLIINISPGSTKSTICSIMFPAWLWTNMPSARSICVSYAYDLAMDLSLKSRDIVLSEKYRRQFKDICLREDQNTKGYFANTKRGYRVAAGTGGSITGFHGHFLIVDDPIDPNQSVSEAELKVVNRWMGETLPTRKVDKRITPTILIMQRLHQNDPTGMLLEKRKAGVRHICLPAELTPKVRPRRLRKMYIDGLMDIERLSRPVLEEALADLGQYAYSGQFLQDPVPAGGGMFRISQTDIIPSPPRCVRTVRYWDKAGTSKGGAFTVGTKMALSADREYIVIDVVRGQWEAAERERVIKQTAISDTRSVHVYVEQEPGSGGKESAQNTIKNLAGFVVRADRPLGDKTLRADPYAVQVNGGNVKLVRGAWNREYLNELQYFPMSKYKDQVDSSSGAFAMLTKFRKMVGAFGGRSHH